MGRHAAAQDDFDALMEAIRAAYEFRAENMESLRLVFEGGDTHDLAPGSAPADSFLVGEMAQDGVLTVSQQYGLRLDRIQDMLNESTLESAPGFETSDIFRTDLGEGSVYVPGDGIGGIGTVDAISSWADVRYLLMSYGVDAPFLSGYSGTLGSPVRAPMPGTQLSEAEYAEIEAITRLLDQRDTFYLGTEETEEGVRGILLAKPPVIEGYEPGPDGTVTISVGQMTMTTQYKEEEYWLDPARDFVLTRKVSRVPDGSLVEEVRLEYAPNDALGFVPASLEYTAYGPGGAILSQLMRTVVEAEANFPVDEALFEMSFPNGTKVTDTIRGETYVVGREEEGVALAPSASPAGGPTLMLLSEHLAGEAAPPAYPLVDDTPVPALEPVAEPGRGVRWGPVFGCCAAIALVLIALDWARTRRRRGKS